MNQLTQITKEQVIAWLETKGQELFFYRNDVTDKGCLFSAFMRENSDYPKAMCLGCGKVKASDGYFDDARYIAEIPFHCAFWRANGLESSVYNQVVSATRAIEILRSLPNG